MNTNGDSAFTVVKFAPQEYEHIERAFFASSCRGMPLNPRAIAQFVLEGVPAVTEKVLSQHELGQDILLPTVTEPEFPSALDDFLDSDPHSSYQFIPDFIAQPFHFPGDTAREIESIALVAQTSISRVLKSAAYEAVMTQRKAFLAFTCPEDGT